MSSGSEITETAKRELVRRVVESPALSSSRALQAFLQFITDHAISGEVDAIKEQRIGSEVLGRKPDYDPAADNIVRVRAHELRQKLAKYFTTDGADEPIIITIPKGSYLPTFGPRQALTPVPPVPEPLATHPRLKVFFMRGWIPWSLAAILAVALAVRVFAPFGPAAPATTPVAIHDLWSQLFRDPDHEVTVVSADSGFALWQDIAGQNMDLGDYITRKFVQTSENDAKLSEIASRLCTSPADLTVALEVDEVGRAFRGHVRHRYARDMTARELRTGDAVLMGSRRSNPWVGLFESRMNFIMDNTSGSPHFHSKAPRKGELADFGIPSRFDSAGTEKREMVSYAVAAMVPNLSGTGLVVIVEGLSMEGTAAVGDALTNPEKLAILLGRLGHKPGTPVKPFEALVKLTSIPGGFAYPEVVAARYPAE